MTTSAVLPINTEFTLQLSAHDVGELCELARLLDTSMTAAVMISARAMLLTLSIFGDTLPPEETK